MSHPEYTGPVRVRFAPSPTGYLHTGGARTALFNWLWAQQARRREEEIRTLGGDIDGPGSAFILRIEDTDENRSTEASTRAILDSLVWLGLNWDEGPDPDPARFGESIGPYGPYFQSMRAPMHHQVIQELLHRGLAFYCPATPEEMTGPDGKKLLFSPYRDLSLDEQMHRLEKAEGGLPVRLKAPRDVELKWDDLVRGEISFNSEGIGDIIIQKSNGNLLYNFAVTCDDRDMHVTHVLRGEDHISNTPKQLLIYDALGWPRPIFGHVPLIVGMDRARLSKRHGATRVEGYKELGVLPQALFNFLLLIGWAPSGNDAELANKELFSVEEAIAAFNPRGIGKSAGAFNTEKLEYFNGLYLRSLSPEDFFRELLPFIPDDWISARGEEYAVAVCALYQEKLTVLSEIDANAWYFFRDPSPPWEAGETDYNIDTVEKLLIGNPDAPRIISELHARFEQVKDWSAAHLETIVDGFCAESGLGKGKVMQPWRVALTGDKVSPGFYELLHLLGQETTLRRGGWWKQRLS